MMLLLMFMLVLSLVMKELLRRAFDTIAVLKNRPTKFIKMDIEERIFELPDELWAMIFDRIDEGSNRESICLVCKRFLSITKSSLSSLAVRSPSIDALSRKLQRYPNLKKIQLVNFRGDLNKAIITIARSGLNLEELNLSNNDILPTDSLEVLGAKMKNLKVLNCSHLNMTDTDLVRIANSFPSLEELVIMHPCPSNGDFVAVTDESVECLPSKLKRLRKVTLSWNRGISDRSLISLTSNCAFLQHIAVLYYGDAEVNSITEDGVFFVINNSDQLETLKLQGNIKLSSFDVTGSVKFPKNLQSLDFSNMDISDEFLHSIVEARVPLREVSLSSCKGYTFSGINSIVKSCQSLRSLVLQCVKFLTDEHIEQLSKFLRRMTVIELWNCPKLSDSAFVILTERCPFLSCLWMGLSSLGREEYNFDSSMKSFSITSLHISSNEPLSSCRLKRLLNICPNVEELGLGQYFQRDQLDVADVLECSIRIKSLKLSGCSQLKFSRKDVKVPKLQTLEAYDCGIDDDVLARIGMTCPGLVRLDLRKCKKVTGKGVKKVVRSCNRLRYLNLSACRNVNFKVVGWIVSTRPSLRQLISPSHSYPDDEQQKYFLEQGCMVYKDKKYYYEDSD